MRETLVKTQEFKDSPLGKIPKDWDVFPLSKIVKKIKRGPSLAVNNEGVGVRYLTSDNISASGEIDWAVCKHLDIKPELLDSLLSPGDVIVNCVNSAAQIGKVSFIDFLPETTTVGFNNFALSLDKNLVVPRFTFYLISHSLFQRQISATVKPAINQASFSSQDIIALSVPLPSIYEQQRIADILDTVDQTIAHTSSLIAKLKQMKAGLLHDLLTRGLDENGELRDAIAHPEQFKDSPLGGIPKDWDVVTVADIATDVTDGDHHTPERSYSGVFLLSARNVLNGYLALEDVDFVPEHEYQRMIRRCNPEPGDILISCSGTIGRVCEVPANFRCVLVRSAALVKLERTRCQSRFIEAVLQSDIVQSQILMEQLQAAQPNLFQGSINRLRFALPPLNQQERISEIIDTHNNRIRTEEAYREKLKLQKKGLMHDLLIGKVRLKDADKFTPASDTV